MANVMTPPLTLRSEFNDLELTLDPSTGLPVELRRGTSSDAAVPMVVGLRLVTGGVEEIHP